jgi:hypothetical protein
MKTKNYSYKSGEVLAKGILLPPNAPLEYADRQTLWNAVEKAENQWNSQLARGIIMALPNEIPKEELVPLVRDYCREQFVSHGMIADFAIHDKGDGNPHAHVLLTMRAMDENGNWLPKAHKVYDLDENGERIRLPSGQWKSHKENTVDWNDKSKAELWRSKWAEAVNRVYEKHELPVQIDLRSYERQGKEELPTVHLGPAVAHMEQKGIRTEIGDYNREIKAHNTALSRLRKLFAELSEWLKAAIEKLAALTEKEAPQPTILDFVHAYEDMRKSGRVNWSAKGKQTAAVNDVKFAAQVFAWMESTGIYTLDDFNSVVSEHNADFAKLAENAKSIRKLDITLKHIDTVISLKPIYEKSKKGFERQKAKYAAEHKDELEQFKKAVRYLKANKLTPADLDRCKAERSSLLRENEKLERKLRSMNLDPAMVAQIKYRIDKVLDVGEMPQHRTTTQERLRTKQSSEKETNLPEKHHERKEAQGLGER